MDNVKKLLKLRKRRFVLEKKAEKLKREEGKVQEAIDKEEKVNEQNRLRRQRAYDLQIQNQ